MIQDTKEKAAMWELNGDFNMVIGYSLPIALALIVDGIDNAIRSGLYKKNTEVLGEFRKELKRFDHTKPEYGFVIPMFRNPKEIDTCLEDLIQRNNVPHSKIIAVDDFSNDNGETQQAAKKHGVEVLSIEREEKDVRKVRAQRKGAKKWMERGKEYTVCLDSESYITTGIQNIEDSMAEMDFFGLDAMAGQVLPRMRDDANLLERLQLLEYRQAMRSGRGSMYSLKRCHDKEIETLEELKSKYSLKNASQLCISGAFGIFKTEKLKNVLDEMNVSRGGEDVEITLRLLAKKSKIGYHDDIIVETIAPNTFKELFRQRDLWSQFISSYAFHNGYVSGIFRKEDDKKMPDINIGSFSLAVQAVRDIYMHPAKIATLPFLIMEFPMLAAVIGTYLCTDAYSYCKINKKEEKMDFAAASLLPLYRLNNLAGPMTVGYAKQFSRLFKK